MFELIRAGENTYYFDLPSKIGVYTPDAHTAYLIDSGPHKDNAKKVLRVLREKGLEIKAVLNTHAHADHIGGNRYLQEQTGCLIFASDKETDLIRHTYLEPTTLYGGYPHKDLQHKFLLAQESDALPFSDKRFPSEIEIIPLPGHSVEMVGFRTPDNVVFLADCLCSAQTLQKYGVTFQFNIEQCLQSLEKARTLQADTFVSSHAPTLRNIDALVNVNRERILQTAQYLCGLCKTPKTFVQILQSVFNDHGLTMTHEQNVLVGSTVHSYLSYLYDKEQIRIDFKDNILYYESV